MSNVMAIQDGATDITFDFSHFEYSKAIFVQCVAFDRSISISSIKTKQTEQNIIQKKWFKEFIEFHSPIFSTYSRQNGNYLLN